MRSDLAQCGVIPMDDLKDCVLCVANLETLIHLFLL